MDDQREQEAAKPDKLPGNGAEDDGVYGIAGDGMSGSGVNTEPSLSELDSAAGEGLNDATSGEGLGEAAVPLAVQKAALRRRMAAIRDALPAQEREQRSSAICLRFVEAWAETLLSGRAEGKALAAFVPFRSEADVMGIVRWCWKRNVPVALPRVDTGATREMALHLVAGEKDLEPGAYGIREPKPQTPRLQLPGTISLMLVPGLAFDAAGRRLGYGGGYYDRLLEQLSAPQAGAGAPITIAPAFEAQIVDAVPAEWHDATVRFIVTEARIIHVPND